MERKLTARELKLEEIVFNLAQRLRSKLHNDETATPGDRSALLDADNILGEIYRQRFSQDCIQKISD